MSEVLHFLSSVWDSFSQAFSNQAFSSVFSALLGALIGSLSGYWFNRKLEKSRTNERYLIQRKNTIYSPVYKTLLALRRYLQYIDGQENKSTNIKLKEDRYPSRRSFDFHIWKDINQDIRKVYISPRQRDVMDALIKQIHAYELLETRVDKKIVRIRDNFIEKNKSKFKTDNPRYKPNASYAISSSLKWFIYPDNGSEESARTTLTKGLLDAYNFDEPTAKKEANALIAKMKRSKTRDEINVSFAALLHATNEAINVFESTISDIVNKYEGGV